jgi:ribosomal-protein-alanine N-acetyltransferase
MADFQIQSLTKLHLPGILELDKLCFGGWWNLDHSQWELDHAKSHFLVITPLPESAENQASPAVLGNLPLVIGVGGFWQILEEAHINLLAIHPQHQGRGLGKQLLGKLLHKAKELGLERATLEVRASNSSALGLYQRFGFQEAGRRPNYYPDNSEEGVILWLNQLQHREF